MAQKEACMGLVLAHETAHCLGLGESYMVSGHETQTTTDANGNTIDIPCIMNAYGKRTNVENRQFYEDILTGKDGTAAFCSTCHGEFDKDELPDIDGYQ